MFIGILPSSSIPLCAYSKRYRFKLGLDTEQQGELVQERLAVNWVVAKAKEVSGGKELTLKLRALEISI